MAKQPVKTAETKQPAKTRTILEVIKNSMMLSTLVRHTVEGDTIVKTEVLREDLPIIVQGLYFRELSNQGFENV